jgi:hypothetical protein
MTRAEEIAHLDRSIAWAEAQSLAMLEEGVRLFALKEGFLAQRAQLRREALPPTPFDPLNQGDRP